MPETSAPPVDTSQIDAVMAEAALRDIGAAAMMRLEALRWEFLARAAPEQYPEFRRYAAAILPRGQIESAPVAGSARLTTGAATGETLGAGGKGVGPVFPLNLRLGGWIKRRRRLVGAIGGGLAAISVMAYLLYRWLSNADKSAPPPIEPSVTPKIVNSVAAPPTEPNIQPFFETWWLMTAGAIVLAATAYLIWRVVRQRRLRREVNGNSYPLADIAVRIGHNSLFAEDGLRAVMRRLRRHRARPSDRIDVTASIRATLAHGGMSVVRFGHRAVSPEYLLLNESEAPNDHLAALAVALAQRLDEASIANNRYEFFGDPAILRRASDREVGEFEQLETVLSRHAGARLLLLMESADVAEIGTTPDWLEAALLSTTSALVNPRAAQCWSRQERHLNAIGLPSFSADTAGLGQFADRLGSDAWDREGMERLRCDGEPDLAQFFARHRAMLLSATSPAPAQVAAVIANLERWLDAGAMDWLRTIALFPVIAPGFTFFAGATLAEQNLVTQARFLAIARMPWLRTGEMPDWLRAALVAGFSEARLERATAVVEAYLMPPKGPVVSRADMLRLRRAATGSGARRKLIARLAVMDNPLSDDPLMLGALTGTPPEMLGAAMRNFVLPSTPWHRRPVVHAALGALLGLAFLVAYQPPFRTAEVPVETPPADNTGKTEAEVASIGAGADLDNVVSNLMTNDTAALPATLAKPETPTGPTPQPTQPNLLPRLYIQIPDASALAQATELKNQLAGFTIKGQTLLLPEIQTRPNGPMRAQLRCFEAYTCQQAPTLLAAIRDAGIDASIVEFKPGDFSSVARKNHYELWFAADLQDKTKDDRGDPPLQSDRASGAGQNKAPVLMQAKEPQPERQTTPALEQKQWLIPCELSYARGMVTRGIDPVLNNIIGSLNMRVPPILYISDPGDDPELNACFTYVAKKLAARKVIIRRGEPQARRVGATLQVIAVYPQTAQ